MRLKTTLFSICYCLTFYISAAEDSIKSLALDLDVISYRVTLEPDIEGRFIKGKVILRFAVDAGTNQIKLDCGSLDVTKVEGEMVRSFEQMDRELIINLTDRAESESELQIFYQGYPQRGVEFFPEAQRMHTVFFTSEWMICHTPPHDRASIRLDLIIPEGLSSVANGVLREQETSNGRLIHTWYQEAATPAYTYGFAIGSFNELSETQGDVILNYYSSNHSVQELEAVFERTGDMLTFLEEKAGVPYFQSTYSQLLMGNHYQEMSGFAVLKNSYGDLVLNDSTETNLISHELAHQWWGNMITCQSWNHFWLNEGFATFLSAAYNEHRFGREKYLANINSYRAVYEKVKSKGVDKPLVFERWINPTSDDRNLVYFKGAYVLHLLREELGDQKFWQGIKSYTQQFYGKSVTTSDFQQAIEQSTGENLETFFQRWVYYIR